MASDPVASNPVDPSCVGVGSPSRVGSPDLGQDRPPVAFQEDDRGGVTVAVDRHPQSHVCLRDPGLLVFEYVQHIALVVGTLRPTAPAPLRVTHVGGAGLTIARWVQHTRPGSPQIVLEPDAALTEAVRQRLPLPRGHRIRVRAVDGAHGILDLRDGSADVVILDAYAAGRVPAELTTVEWLGQAARVLTADGVLVANLADEPGLGYVARVLASIVASGGFAGVNGCAAIAATSVWKRRHFGNVVVAAGRSELDLAALARAASSAPIPTTLAHGAVLERLARHARALTSTDPELSPEPPEAGAWRVR